MRTRVENDTEFAQTSQLDQYSSFYLIGIGGAGMSGVAKFLLSKGFRVAGSDSTESPITAGLIDLGIDVHIGHSAQGIEANQALIISDAIDLKHSPEVAKSRELGNPIFRRSQALAWLLRDKKTIAITGSHGKSTTTGMLGVAMRASGQDPTIVVGADIPELGGSVIQGDGEYAVIEACEAYDSLRDFEPYGVILTNLELDHVDYHETWENLRATVVKFISRIPKEGFALINELDPGCQEVGTITQITESGFAIEDAEKYLSEQEMFLKGRHNLQNAAAVIRALKQLNAFSREAVAAIADFRGAERRQTRLYDPSDGKGNLGNFTLIDDYAHHPTEIEASLNAIRKGWITEGSRKRLVVVFQPHLYSRTEPLIQEFADALSLADFVVLTDIYPAREDPIPGVSSLRIVERLGKPNCYIPSRHLLPRKVADLLQEGDVVVSMGAGNIDQFPPLLLQELESRNEKPRVLVVYGGDSPERQVSLISGRSVYAALQRLGYEVTLLDATEALLSGASLSHLAGPDRPDIAFLEVHGTHAEDGAIQGLFELLHIPYTGSGILSSALALDKNRAKELIKSLHIPVPEGRIVRAGDPMPTMTFPCVVKPNTQGSTVGLTIVQEPSLLAEAVEKALAYDHEVLIEEFIEGIEISVPVLIDQTLPAVEIVPQSGFYDFAMKYTSGATEEICPARISPEQAKLAAQYAQQIHDAFQCQGVSRTDMIVQEDRIVVLEINTLPGMTATSLVPNAAKAAGISYDELVERILKDAWEKSKKEKEANS